MIQVENLSKGFGGQTLFENISFNIHSRERVGLVGRNGHGKTTLFRLIVGEMSPDSGMVTIPRNYRIGYIRQELEFTEDTLLQEGMRHLPELEKDHYWKVEKVLTGLGFTEEDMDRHPREFSGGFQVRLNLAKVLVNEPDLLLLDEPTNYLDITSIRWIKRFLNEWPRELLLITHDRSFMDEVVTHTIAIHRKKVKKIRGNTEKIYNQLAQEEEVYEKTRLNEERREKEMREFISRFQAKARLANLVQSRVKTLEKKEKKEKLEKIKTLDFSFKEKPFKGKNPLTVKNLEFGYEADNSLIAGLDLTARPAERIGIVGKNGKGKTTLLKLLAKELKPDQGKVEYHAEIEKGYFEQTNIKDLNDEYTVEEEIIHSAPDVNKQQARNVCGLMMFEDEAALKKIGVLSGGEKSRVMLGKLLVKPVNLLLLDEPTNHLDMESNDALLAALDNFDGILIMVTHNELFLHALASRLIVFKENGVSLFEGSYSEFLQKEGWEGEEGEMEPGGDEKIEKGSPAVVSKKDLRRLRTEILSERSSVLKPLEKRIGEIENRIEENENELSGLSQAMQEATVDNDGKKINELSRAIYSRQTAVDHLFEELESATETLDAKRKEYENKLRTLENIREN